jgi:hypothetical protein
MASASAASSIKSPRAVLMMRIPFFDLPVGRHWTMFFVVAVDGMCSDRKSDRVKQLVERDQLDAKVRRNIFRNKRIVRDDAHVEGCGAARHLLADASETRQPERLLADLFAQELLFLPFALLHRLVGARDVTCHRQHQTDGQFGDADTVGPGCIHHDDAAAAGGRYVDVVHAGARACDRAKPGRRVDERGGHFRGAAHDDRVGIGEVGGELFGRAACTGIDAPPFRA